MQLQPDLINDTEEHYLKILIDLLDKKLIEEDEAKRITNEFLNLAPYLSYDDLKSKFTDFCRKFTQFADLVRYLSTYEEEYKNKQLIGKIQTLIKENKIDDALKITDIK